MDENKIHKKWKKILRGITLEDAIRCEGYHEDLENGLISKAEVKEYLYFLPKETEPAEDQQDDSKTVINTFIRLSKLINGDLNK